MDEHRVGTMLWRGKYLILIAVAAMLIAVAVLTLTTSKQYEATTILRVDQAAAPVNGSDAYNAQQASATQAVNYATLLTSTSFLQRVASKIENGFAFSGAGLGSHLGAHAITNTNLIVVTFTAGSRKDALHYARTVADQSIALFKADFVSTRTRQQAAAQAKLTDRRRQDHGPAGQRHPVGAAADRSAHHRPDRPHPAVWPGGQRGLLALAGRARGRAAQRTERRGLSATGLQRDHRVVPRPPRRRRPRLAARAPDDRRAAHLGGRNAAPA